MMADLPQLDILFWVAMCIVFIALSGLFSGSETGLYCINRLRLRITAHEGNRAATRLRTLLEDQPGLLFTTLLGTNVANYLAPVCLAAIFLASISPDMSQSVRESIEHRAELWTTLILTPIVFIFGEIVPKNIFQRRADTLMLAVSPVLTVSHHIFRLTGLVWLQRKVSSLLISRMQKQPTSGSAFHPRREMYQLLQEGAAEGTLSRTQLFMLERVHALKSVRVSSIMVPCDRTVMLSADANMSEVGRIVQASPFSRMPIHRPGDRKRVIGTVHVLDLLMSSQDAKIAEHRRPPIEILSDTTVLDTLSALQQERRRMAVIVDYMGRCLGIVTIKDLVEEIVGELAAW